MDCTRHAQRIHEFDDSGQTEESSAREVLEIRKPLLLLRLSGVLLLRYADRRLSGLLLLNAPPRNTRLIDRIPFLKCNLQQ